jgi:flavorubredoxin
MLLSSYGWGGGAAKQATEILGQTKIELIGAMDINGRPKEADLQKAADLGKLMADKVKDRPLA